MTRQFKVTGFGEQSETFYFNGWDKNIFDAELLLLVQTEDVHELFALDELEAVKEVVKYLKYFSDTPYNIIGVLDRRNISFCPNCGSTNLSFEGFIKQDENGELEAVGLCDKGHSCDDCEQEIKYIR